MPANTVRSLMGLGLLALALGACASARDATPKERTLYQRLGGREGIALVVDDFVTNALADPRIAGRFRSLQPPAVFKLRTNLSDQICDATGGPCAYTGRDMRTVHAGMNITETEWNATVEALVKALDKHKVPAKEKSELLALLGPMKPDIVGR